MPKSNKKPKKELFLKSSAPKKDDFLFKPIKLPAPKKDDFLFKPIKLPAPKKEISESKAKSLPKNGSPKIRELKNNIKIKELKGILKSKKQKIELREKAFIEVFQPRFNFSPVLSKMQSAPASADLENIAQAAPKPRTDDKNEKGGEFSYLPSQAGKGEAKYISADSVKYTEMKTISKEQILDRKRDPFEMARVNLTPMQQPEAEQKMYERYESVGKFDIDKERKKDAFKTPEIKYTPSKS